MSTKHFIRFAIYSVCVQIKSERAANRDVFIKKIYSFVFTGGAGSLDLTQLHTTALRLQD